MTGIVIAHPNCASVIVGIVSRVCSQAAKVFTDTLDSVSSFNARVGDAFSDAEFAPVGKESSLDVRVEDSD